MEPASTLRGWLDQQLAAVGDRSAAYEPLSLQLIDLARNAGWMLGELMGELALGGRAVANDPIEDLPREDLLATGLEGVRDGEPQATLALAHQSVDLLGEVGRAHSGRSHASQV